MYEQSNGQLHTPSRNDGQAGQSGPVPAEARGEQRGEQPRFTVDKPNTRNNEAVLGPFTVRDLTVFGSTLVLFIASLIPMFAVRYNLWNLGSLFFLGLGVLLPVIVTALFVARRVSPGTKIRVGSLSIDQFGSVVASFSLAFFFLATAGAFVPSLLLGLIGALGLFTATVLARLFPSLAGDFLHRAEAPAHIVARDAAQPVRKPRAPKEPKAAGAGKPKDGGSTLAGWAKRVTPGKKAENPETASHDSGARGHQEAPYGAGTPAGTAAGTAAGVAGASAGAAAASPYARPAGAEPATQANGVVPSASTPSASTPSASPTPTAAYTPPAAGQDSAPAAEQTQAATSAPAPAPAGHGAASGTAAEQTQAAAPTPQTAAQTAPQTARPEETQAAGIPASAAVAPAATSSSAPAAAHDAPTALTPQVRSQEPIGATVDPAQRPEAGAQPAYEAFWFAVAQPRTAVDERSGAPAFVIEPGGWVLALEDRGHEFLVQHTDGRVGVLRDLSNIERG